MREDWVECKLEDICKINLGQSPPSSTYNTNKIGLPFYQGKAEFGDKYPTPRVWCNSPKKIAEKNDILISVRAPVGATNVANERCGIGRGLAAINYLYNDYLLHYLKASESKLDSIGTGTTFKAISGEQVKSFQIPIPPLPEQRAIVKKIEALFSSLDAGISDFKKAQEQLKIYRQAVLKKAFEGELTREWRKNQTNLPSAEELLKQIEEEREKYYNQQIEDWKQTIALWEENGKEGKKSTKPSKLTIPEPSSEEQEKLKWILPKNWLWKQLGDIAFVTKLAGFEYTDYVTYVADGDLPVLKAENVGKNGFKMTEFSLVKSDSVANLSRTVLNGGELLVVFVGAGTGNVASVPVNKKYFLGPNIGMARPYFVFNGKFLEYFYSSTIGKSFFLASIKAVAQPSLSMGTIRQAPLVICSLLEQTQIVKEIEARLSVCDAVGKQIQDSLEQAEALRQSILKKAFEGRLLSEEELNLCKQAPDYEPASLLLEKIKAEKEANKAVKKKTKKTK